MLLYNKYTNKVDYCWYSSTNLAHSQYINDGTGTLAIVFNNGFIYHYHNVDEGDYIMLKMSPSNGTVLSNLIRNKYVATRQTRIDVNKLNELKEEFIKMNESTANNRYVIEVTEDGSEYALKLNGKCISSGQPNNVNVIDLLKELNIPCETVKVGSINEDDKPKIIG